MGAAEYPWRGTRIIDLGSATSERAASSRGSASAAASREAFDAGCLTGIRARTRNFAQEIATIGNGQMRGKRIVYDMNCFSFVSFHVRRQHPLQFWEGKSFAPRLRSSAAPGAATTRWKGGSSQACGSITCNHRQLGFRASRIRKLFLG